MSPRRRWRPDLVAVALAATAGGACANIQAPPGSGPDRTPPEVAELEPPDGAAAPGFHGHAELRFDEPLADPRNLNRLIEVSPADAMQIEPRRSGFSFRPRDGWRQDAVYVVTIDPGVRDLLRNQTTAPIEWLFATGDSVPDTRVEGRLQDRLDGRGLRGGRVLFLSGDSVPYTAVADTGGNFRLPSLPLGSYVAYGFLDQNGNRRLDREFEPWDSASFQLPDEGARAFLLLRAYPPDSTPPVLVSATAPDSLELVLRFDDPLDPEAPLGSTLVEVRSAESGDVWPVTSIRHGEPAKPAPADSGVAVPDLGAESGDSLAAPGDSLAAADSPEALAQEAEEPLPSTALTVLLGRPLRPGEYEVRASGLTNLRGLTGGGDTTFVYEPPPPPVEPVPVDSSRNATPPAPAETPPAPGNTQPAEDMDRGSER